MLLLIGCGGTRGVGAQRAATELEAAYPALRWVPADAAHVAVTARVSSAALAARELADLAAVATGMDAAGLDRALRAALGASPIDAADLAAAGIDLDGSAALFAGPAGSLTAALPVADGEQLDARLERLDGRGAAVEHQGHQVRTWSDGDVDVSWVALDGWLLVNGGPRGAGLAWLDRALAASGGGMGASQELAAAVSRGRSALAGGQARADGGGDRAAAPSLIGMVRLGALARELAASPGAPEGLGACVRRASAAAPRLVWAADVSTEAGALWAALDLAPAAAAALRQHVAGRPPPGFLAYRDAAALSLGWSIELPWLEQVRGALSCPRLDRPLRDPVREATGYRGPRGWHVAATEIDLDDMSGAGAVHLLLADRELVAAQLESIPARSLFERTRRVAGVPVQVLSVPGLPTIMYRLAGERFTLAVGDGVMAEVLRRGEDGGEAGEHDARAAELAHARLQPQRLPQLGELVAAALSALGAPDARATAAVLAERLSRYEEAALSARLDGNSVAIFARMRRAPTGRSLPSRRLRTSLW